MRLLRMGGGGRPVRVGELGVGFGEVNGSVGEEVGSGEVGSGEVGEGGRSCHGCFEVVSKEFEGGVEWVGAEVAGAVGVGVAGVLWLAVLSG